MTCVVVDDLILSGLTCEITQIVVNVVSKIADTYGIDREEIMKFVPKGSVNIEEMCKPNIPKRSYNKDLDISERCKACTQKGTQCSKRISKDFRCVNLCTRHGKSNAENNLKYGYFTPVTTSLTMTSTH